MRLVRSDGVRDAAHAGSMVARETKRTLDRCKFKTVACDCPTLLSGAGRPERLALLPFREEETSVQAISWVIEHSKHKGNSLTVLIMIANHAKSDGTGAWPSIPTLAKEARISERTVQRTIGRLTRWQHNFAAELICERGKGPNGCNLYSLPGVKLPPGGRQIVTPVVSDIVTGTGVTIVSPEPSFNLPKERKRTRSRAISPVYVGTGPYASMRCKACGEQFGNSQAKRDAHACVSGLR